MRPLSLEMNHMSNMNGRIVGHEMMNSQPQHHQQQHQQQHQKNSNVNNGQQDQENSSNNSNECSVREQDRFMPIANVIRIMRKILPPHAKISDDAKETIQECVSEYISFITGEANERCQREQRKTITAEDVLWAMSKLGFDDYIEPLTLYLHRYRELDGDRGGSIRTTCDQLRSRSAMDQYAAAFGPPVFHIGPPPPHPHPHPPAAYYGGSSSACTDYLKEQPASAPPTHSHSHSHSAAPPANSVPSYAPFAHHN